MLKILIVNILKTLKTVYFKGVNFMVCELYLNNAVFYIFYFIYLSLAALGLCCCARAFSSCGERGLRFLEVHGLLIAVASLIVEHRL